MKKAIVTAGLLVPMFFAGGSMAAAYTTTVSCNNGKFWGSAEVRVDRNNVTGAYGVDVLKYKIHRSSGQSGGNKANVNLKGYYYVNSKEHKTQSHSSDNMKQDGAWHDLRLRVVGTPRPNRNATGSHVEFVFDKKGTDPKCTARVF
jgi:hypothetical protein